MHIVRSDADNAQELHDFRDIKIISANVPALMTQFQCQRLP